MKTVMKNVVVFAQVLVTGLVLAGCNSDPVVATSNNSSTPAHSVTPSLAMAVTQGCSITATATGGTVNCADGSSAVITNGTNGTNGINGTNGTNGTNGAAGAQGVAGAAGAQGAAGATGATGAAGAPGAFGLESGGIQIGDYLVSMANGYVVWDKTNNVAVSYGSGGQMVTSALYYPSNDCSGTAYVPGSLLANNVVKEQGTGDLLFKITTTTAQFYASSEWNGSTCAAITPTQSTYSATTPYTSPSNIPHAFAIPVSVVKL